MAFDNEQTDMYTNVYPSLQAAGCKGTTYIVSSYINQAGNVTSAQLQEMSASGTVDVGNHSVTHTQFTSLTLEQQEDELAGCTNFLNGIGLTRASLHHAFVGGKFNTDSLTALSNLGFLSARNSLFGNISFDEVHDAYGVYGLRNAFIVRDTDSLQDVKDAIDAAVANNEIIGIMFHNIVDELTEGNSYEWLKTDFQALLTYINSLNLPTRTISEWYALYQAAYL